MSTLVYAKELKDFGFSISLINELVEISKEIGADVSAIINNGEGDNIYE